MSNISDLQLFDSLKELKIIEEEKLKELYTQSEELNLSFEEVVLKSDLISDKDLGILTAELLGVPFISLDQVSISDEILNIIPEVVAKKQKLIAFKKDSNGLHLATYLPENKQIQEFISRKAGIPVNIYYSTYKDIENALNLYAKELDKAFDDIIKEHVEEAKQKEGVESPIVKLADTIFDYAYYNRTSDIHIEPFEKYSLLRFRIDGVLEDIVKFPIDLHERLVTRIRVMSNLRTDQHQSAQDGKLQYQVNDETFDVRVSIVPTTEGSKVVMRLLSSKSRQFSLMDLGFSTGNLDKVKEAYKKPHGLILSTGPTGSGKTTTLYSILKLLNKPKVNIMTIEDPVEYDMERINQIQVNTATELTFAKGLRSIVRQDPDIILVGEIRDQETANIAINAAMTGHLVLSTLHTNDAATAIPRLLDMGVEPFLVASTVNIIVAQRLVRKIHSGCRTSADLDLKEISPLLSQEIIKKTFGDKKSVRTYVGKGCDLDHQTGYKGRIGIFEVLSMDDEIRQAVVDKKDASEIKGIAIKNGMTTMVEDGLEKVKSGLTTIEEILRVAKE